MSKSHSPLALELAEARTNAKFWKERARFLAASVKSEKQDLLLAKSAARRQREAAAIAKAQLKLQKLLDKSAAPVGVKALKANRKPSKAVVTVAA